MIKKIIILGSTGSIGKSTLNSIKADKRYKIQILAANKNAKKLLEQAVQFKVKDAFIQDLNIYNIYKIQFKKKNIRLHHDLKNIHKILKEKIDFAINAISGIDGLEPTLKTIPFTKNILISNKESIICGWHLIKKKLSMYETNFIPIDSEHFSIWKLIKFENQNLIEKIILTASGGPFLNVSKKKIKNIKPQIALKHPNWKMGKKISIDSSTLMNKIFEFIEAKKIFNLKKKNISIVIHPSSYVHAIIYFSGGIVKLLAHETDMSIPISNALGIKKKISNKFLINNLNKLNQSNFTLPNKRQFPLLSIIDLVPEKNSYFETILTTINDTLVYKYLKGEINYISIQKNLLNLLKSTYFKRYYNLSPKNIYDIKKMIIITSNYLKSNLKNYV